MVMDHGLTVWPHSDSVAVSQGAPLDNFICKQVPLKSEWSLSMFAVSVHFGRRRFHNCPWASTYKSADTNTSSSNRPPKWHGTVCTISEDLLPLSLFPSKSYARPPRHCRLVPTSLARTMTSPSSAQASVAALSPRVWQRMGFRVRLHSFHRNSSMTLFSSARH